ncbi:transposase [Isoptericola luteus]|uniref:transposase n=1 Tax=Isoptericola luteus TaxID=2879484 RepID=UPI003BF47863
MLADSLQTGPPSAASSRRSDRDAGTTALIEQVHAENYGVYGARKVHAELHRRLGLLARCRLTPVSDAGTEVAADPVLELSA